MSVLIRRFHSIFLSNFQTLYTRAAFFCPYVLYIFNKLLTFTRGVNVSLFSKILILAKPVCKDSQKRMDTWCQITPGFATAMDLGCSGELKARFDRSKNSTKKMWRCYHESALTADLSRYNDKLKSPCYYTRHRQLNQVLRSCKFQIHLQKFKTT